MIRISNTWTGGFEGAIRGMRNPYESHEKSDSHRCRQIGCSCCIYDNDCPMEDSFDGYFIGEADMALCKKLIKAGSEHRKFLRMIHVQADVVAPRYWWAEMDKYKWVEANSSSTMHLITKRPLTIDDFSNDFELVVMQELIAEINELIDIYNDGCTTNEEKEYYFAEIKQLLPESYNQLRTIDTNYEALLSIHRQRKNHRLTEWREFCEWIKTLPYMEEFLEAME